MDTFLSGTGLCIHPDGHIGLGRGLAASSWIQRRGAFHSIPVYHLALFHVGRHRLESILAGRNCGYAKDLDRR